MAIDNADLERAFDELRQATGSTQSAFNAMAGAASNATNEQNKYTNAVKGATSALTRGLAGFASATSSGESSLKTFNSVIDGAVGAVSKIAGAFGAAGQVIGGAAQGIGEAAKFLVTQVDRTAKTFNTLSQVGAVGAKGMSQFYDAAKLQGERLQTGGLSLEQFSKVVMDNSQILQQFGGTTYDGVNRFSESLQNFTTGNDDTLRKLGMSAEQMGQFQANYIKQQTILGRGQNMTTQDLINGTKQYARELDLLQKLTGASREQLDKEKEMRMANTGYLAMMRQMEREGQGQAAKGIEDFVAKLSVQNKEAAAGFQTLLRTNGAAIDDNSRRLQASTGGAAAQIARDLRAGGDPVVASQRLAKAFEEVEPRINQFQQSAENADETFLGLAGTVKVQTNLANTDAKVTANAAEAQKTQLEQTDDLTKSTINAQKNMEKFGRTVDGLGFKFANQTAKAIDKMTESMVKLVNWVDSMIGGGGGGGAGGTYKGVNLPGPKAGPTAGEKAKAEDIALKQADEKKAAEEVGRANLKILQAKNDNDRKAAELEFEQSKKKLASAQAATAAAKTAPVSGGAAGPSGKMVGGDDERLKSLNLKGGFGGQATAGGKMDERLISLAQKVQEMIPGVTFTGFNDAYHSGMNSKHAEGTAVDIALNPAPSSAEEAIAMRDKIAGLGFGSVKDEYFTQKSRGWTGGHIHAELASGGILSGPRSGYNPSITMHGTEAVTPLNADGAIPITAMQDDNGIWQKQLDKLDELVSVMKSQVNTSEKLLRMQS